MRFLLDQDVYTGTARLLAELGHDVVRIAQIGLSEASDEDLLNVAHKQHRILVTRDRDFGSLVFVKRLGAGVLYLRLLPSTQRLVNEELERVITSYTEEELSKAFVVIEPAGHRFRKIPSK